MKKILDSLNELTLFTQWSNGAGVSSPSELRNQDSFTSRTSHGHFLDPVSSPAEHLIRFTKGVAVAPALAYLPLRASRARRPPKTKIGARETYGKGSGFRETVWKPSGFRRRSTAGALPPSELVRLANRSVSRTTQGLGWAKAGRA